MPTDNIKTTEMQSHATEPFIEDPAKTTMDEGQPRARRIGGRKIFMAEHTPPESAADTDFPEAGANLMPAIPDTEAGVPISAASLPPMKEREASGPDRHEGYVRLRMRVEKGEMTVVGVRRVEGPLVQPERLHSGLAFEILRDQKRLGMGTIADHGERRSFPPPEDTPGLEGHHIAELPGYEFNVRIPQKDFTEKALPRLRVSVYRIKGETPDKPIAAESFAKQYSREMRPVAELKGINVRDLPNHIQDEIKQILKAS